MNESRVKGLIEKIVHEEYFEKASWLLGDSIENFTQSVVDDFAKQNIAFHGKSGLSPKLRRTVVGNCCDWCEQKAGLYNYPVPDDVYLRHRKCDCLVEYFPGNGKVQNSHTKQWRKETKNDRINTKFKLRNIIQSGAKNYIRDVKNAKYIQI